MAVQVRWFDAADTTEEFNVNNLTEHTPTLAEQPWMAATIKNANPTADDLYAALLRHYGMRPTSWVPLHPLWSEGKLRMVAMCEADVAALQQLGQIRCTTGRDLTADDVECFSPALLAWIEAQLTMLGGSVFVRMTDKSTKDSMNGHCALHTTMDVLDALTSSRRLLKYVTGNTSDQWLVMMPWMPIDAPREYRVLVIDERVAGISQQHCYSSYGRETLTSEARRLAEAHADAVAIIAWYAEHKAAFAALHYEHVTLDVYVIDATVHLIECNPPSLWCASGSSLFRKSDFFAGGCLCDPSIVTVLIR